MLTFARVRMLILSLFRLCKLGPVHFSEASGPPSDSLQNIAYISTSPVLLCSLSHESLLRQAGRQ